MAWVDPDEYRSIRFGEVISGSALKFGSGYKFGQLIFVGPAGTVWSE